MYNRRLKKLLALFAAVAMLASVFPATVFSVTSDEAQQPPVGALKAYPGAEGYGAYSVGGRQGTVYHVTNLNSDGEGSLTYGLEQVSGSRTIVFDVGGVIDLTDLGRALEISGESGANVTVAGQTAPYPGITVKGCGIDISNTHDVIIRNIKVRIGGVMPDGENYTQDPLTITASEDVIIDHCSMEWAIDMGFSVTGRDITISNTIFAKSLLDNSPHERGGHAYGGMIDEGSKRVTFAKNYLSDNTLRSPRITDADWVDAYNSILYNCNYGFELYNYEFQNRNVRLNVHNNYARKGPSLSNSTPYRALRGRDYSGGIMAYFSNNYGRSSSNSLNAQATKGSTLQYVLNFGSDNGKAGTDYDLSNVTLEEWNSNPASYNNNDRTSPAATITYMDYPFPAPRGDVIEVYTGGDTSSGNNLVTYAVGDNGMGATRPARDLYDTMILTEMEGGAKSSATLSADQVSPFFEELEKRTGRDYSEFKTERTWKVKQGAGPVLKGASADSTKPVDWDNYTDTNANNPAYDAAAKYGTNTTSFEVGDWWGEYCGSPGQETVYTLRDNASGDEIKTSDESYDSEKYTLVSTTTEYLPTERTVSDLVPSDWVYEDFPEIAEFMNSYREANYPGMTDSADSRYNPSYKITWDTMKDGIPDWYKEYRGLDKDKYLGDTANPETGYTYLEEYIQFMAGDKPLAAENTGASIENFKVNNIGFGTAQIFWNTDYRASCVVEYGTAPGEYSESAEVSYGSDTDYMHTYHACTIIGLKPDTQYYYRITATDENGNISVAEYDVDDGQKKYMTFKTEAAQNGEDTLPPDKVQNLEFAYRYDNTVGLKWSGNPNTDAEYEIYYDTQAHEDLNLYNYKISGIPANVNEYAIENLENNREYSFVVAAVNANGKTASDVLTGSTTNMITEYDFSAMSDEEISEFMSDAYYYNLQGSIYAGEDPDTGKKALNLVDETSTHGMYLDLKLPKLYYDPIVLEVKAKIMYQKQSDVLNGQIGMMGTSSNTHNTIDFELMADSMANSGSFSDIWETAGTLTFDSESTPITEADGRFDGTMEQGTILYNDDEIGDYLSGITPGSDLQANAVLPETMSAASDYRYQTAYGDARYGQIDHIYHSVWYYDKNSSEYVTYKIAIDPRAGKVNIYENDRLIGSSLEYKADNVGKLRIESSARGFSWFAVEQVRAYGDEFINEPTATPKPTATAAPTATPAPMATPTATPTATAAPTETPKPTGAPETKYELYDVYYGEDGMVNVDVRCNVAEPEYSAMLVLASYSEDELLTDCRVVEISGSYAMPVDFPKNENQTVKAFLWRSGTFEPICEPAEVRSK